MAVESFIGWRYLKAKRKQAFISLITVISIGGVAVGVAVLIVVLAVMNGFEEDLKNKILGVNSHIVVLKTDAPMDNYSALLPKIRSVKGVESAEPFIYSQVMIGAFGGTAGAVLRGVDPVITAENGHLGYTVIAGELKGLADDDTPGIILGKELAHQLGAMVGDKVKVISPLGRVTPLGGRAPKVGVFHVVGVFESGMYEYDSNMAYLSIKRAQKFLNLGAGITGIEVRVDDVYDAAEIKSDIVKALGASYKGRDWMEMNRNLFSALKLEKAAMFVILLLTVLVAAFNIISTLILVVLDKARDIAILKSMGADALMIMKIFIFQGLLIGVLGALLGLFGGIALCDILERYQFIRLPSDIYYVTTLPVRMEVLDITIITITAVLISFTATLYPAWQASRLDPVEALRYE